MDARIAAHRFVEALIRPPTDVVSVEARADLDEVVLSEPALKQRRELLARQVAIAFVVEVQARLCRDGGNCVGYSGGFAQAAPLALGNRDHHRTLSVAADEVAAEGPVDLIAHARPL